MAKVMLATPVRACAVVVASSLQLNHAHQLPYLHNHNHRWFEALQKLANTTRVGLRDFLAVFSDYSIIVDATYLTLPMTAFAVFAPDGRKVCANTSHPIGGRLLATLIT